MSDPNMYYSGYSTDPYSMQQPSMMPSIAPAMVPPPQLQQSQPQLQQPQLQPPMPAVPDYPSYSSYSMPSLQQPTRPPPQAQPTPPQSQTQQPQPQMPQNTGYLPMQQPPATIQPAMTSAVQQQPPPQQTMPSVTQMPQMSSSQPQLQPAAASQMYQSYTIPQQQAMAAPAPVAMAQPQQPQWTVSVAHTQAPAPAARPAAPPAPRPTHHSNQYKPTPLPDNFTPHVLEQTKVYKYNHPPSQAATKASASTPYASRHEVCMTYRQAVEINKKVVDKTTSRTKSPRVLKFLPVDHHSRAFPLLLNSNPPAPPKPRSTTGPAATTRPSTHIATITSTTPAPPRATLTAAEAKSITNPVLRQAYDVLAQTMAEDRAKIFHFPVNPRVHGCPDYLEKISHPMDLGTVETRLRANHYKNEQELINDVDLTFNNACTYNSIGHPVNTLAVQLRTFFHDRMDALTRKLAKKSTSKTSTSKSEPAAAKKRPKPTSDSDDDLPVRTSYKAPARQTAAAAAPAAPSMLGGITSEQMAALGLNPSSDISSLIMIAAAVLQQQQAGVAGQPGMFPQGSTLPFPQPNVPVPGYPVPGMPMMNQPIPGMAPAPAFPQAAAYPAQQMVVPKAAKQPKLTKDAKDKTPTNNSSGGDANKRKKPNEAPYPGMPSLIQPGMAPMSSLQASDISGQFAYGLPQQPLAQAMSLQQPQMTTSTYQPPVAEALVQLPPSIPQPPPQQQPATGGNEVSDDEINLVQDLAQQLSDDNIDEFLAFLEPMLPDLNGEDIDLTRLNRQQFNATKQKVQQLLARQGIAAGGASHHGATTGYTPSYTPGVIAGFGSPGHDDGQDSDYDDEE